MAFKVTKKGPARAAQRTGRYVFVGSRAKKFPAGVLVCRRLADLPTFVRETRKNRVFVSYRRSSTDNLLQEGLKLGRGAHMGKLLTLERLVLKASPHFRASLSELSGRFLVTGGSPWRSFPRRSAGRMPRTASSTGPPTLRAKHSPSCGVISQRLSSRLPSSKLQAMGRGPIS